MTKVFTLDSTTGQWDGNSLTDSISSQPLGILMPGITIDRVSVTSTNGLMGWRIQNAVTLAVSRCGVATEDNYTCNESSYIQPYRITANDILVTYPLETDTTASQSNVLAWITTSKGKELYKAQDVVDSTATALKTAVNSQTLGDNAFGSMLLGVEVQAESMARVESIDILDNTGGTIATYYGSVRGTSPGAMDLKYNLSQTRLNIPVQKGMTLRVTTISG